MPESDLLRRLAARLAQDESIDWEAEEHAAPEEHQRAAIRQLRLVAAMAGFYRAVPPSGEGEDLSASISIARSVAGGGEGTAERGVAEARARTAERADAGIRDGAARPDAAPAPEAASASELRSGSRWGHLEILEHIGGGAFGEVYQARDTRLDRVVALKLLTQETSDSADERVREARLLAKTRHPNVVVVHGADRIDNRVGIWMEFLEGETLDRVLRVRGMLDAREAALIGIDLCRALSAVHAAGIIHQDVKLSNVMRATGGRIVLMDFGLGRETAARGRAGPRRSLSGTPLFMAPEVLGGAEPSARSDVYSLGVILFALVTGSLPVDAASLAELRAQHERGAIKHARDIRPDLPENFAHLLDRILSADPQSRFATPGEVERALLRSLGAAVEAGQTKSRATSRRSALAVAVVCAGLLVIAARWLEIWADTAGEGFVLLTPRQEIQSVPYALRSSVAESGVTGGQWQSGASGIFYLGGNVAIGQTSDTNSDRRFIVNTGTANANPGWFKNNTANYAALVVQNDAVDGIGLYDGWSDKHYLAGRVGLGTFTTADAQLTVEPVNTSVGVKALGFGGAGPSAAVWGIGGGGVFFGDCAGVTGQSNFGNGVEGIASDVSYYGGYFDNTAGGAALYADGLAKVRSLQIIGGADLVEGFDTKSDAAREPGTVVVIDEKNAGGLRASDAAYDRKVAGVVSGAGGVEAGIRLGQEGKLDGETLVAMTGRVYVKCASENGAIRPGDLLTTSTIPGHAMRATDHDLANGAVIGKAMSSLDARTGLVLVLVNLQ